MIKVLREGSPTFKKLEELNNHLQSLDIGLHATPFNGIIYKIGKEFFKYSQEGEYPDVIPPYIEGRYILCDQWGNTDFYQDES